MDLQTRHLALSSLFTETLMMLNNSSISTAESLRVSLRRWIDSRVQGLLAMPLLTAACHSLASVRHMAETTEACITSYFSHGRSLPLPHSLCSLRDAPGHRSSGIMEWIGLERVLKITVFQPLSHKGKWLHTGTG